MTGPDGHAMKAHQGPRERRQSGETSTYFSTPLRARAHGSS